MNGELVILVTSPSREAATVLAEALVNERLAACVNIVPGIESIYHWDGQIMKDTEVLLIVKSTDERFALLEQRIRELHSYTTPEIIALRIEKGSPDYLQWLHQSVAGPAHPSESS